MFDPNLYVVAGACATAIAATAIVCWSDSREKAAKRALTSCQHGKTHYQIECSELNRKYRDQQAVSAGLNDRIDRALAQATDHPNTRLGKIVDILRGEVLVVDHVFRADFLKPTYDTISLLPPKLTEDQYNAYIAERVALVPAPGHASQDHIMDELAALSAAIYDFNKLSYDEDDLWKPFTSQASLERVAAWEALQSIFMSGRGIPLHDPDKFYKTGDLAEFKYDDPKRSGVYRLQDNHLWTPAILGEVKC